MIYNVHFPLLRNSTAVCEITDREGTVVGYIQRYHATRMQQLVNLLLDNMFNNVCACDREKKPVVNIVEINNPGTLLREKWVVHVGGGQFQLENKSKIRTHPRFLYRKHDTEIWIQKEFADRTVRFVQHNRTVAEAVSEGLMPPKSCRVAFHLAGSETDIYEIAALYYVFKLKTG
ncbi:Putative uncharacterized protein [Thermobacillus xylanilyticus]|uniref:Tubby C-terminal domain-containing protein n=1 Tax=Thermobacillus xylanilyticus TaxID=76633 RepID=A0ABN7RXJ8_THEXY|nr:hypothetical protein [Thermobacillus xylanilyticus]CAG5086212.1 Putative uncharacterized protein [Thermobacillus xylanilyticus]